MWNFINKLSTTLIKLKGTNDKLNLSLNNDNEIQTINVNGDKQMLSSLTVSETLSGDISINTIRALREYNISTEAPDIINVEITTSGDVKLGTLNNRIVIHNNALVNKTINVSTPSSFVYFKDNIKSIVISPSTSLIITITGLYNVAGTPIAVIELVNITTPIAGRLRGTITKTSPLLSDVKLGDWFIPILNNDGATYDEKVSYSLNNYLNGTGTPILVDIRNVELIRFNGTYYEKISKPLYLKQNYTLQGNSNDLAEEVELINEWVNEEPTNVSQKWYNGFEVIANLGGGNLINIPTTLLKQVNTTEGALTQLIPVLTDKYINIESIYLIIKKLTISYGNSITLSIGNNPSNYDNVVAPYVFNIQSSQYKHFKFTTNDTLINLNTTPIYVKFSGVGSYTQTTANILILIKGTII